MAGYDIGVRSRLNKEGVSNDRISYDQTNGVMVDSKSFMKPSKVYQGTAYTDNTGFNKAWDTFNKAQQPPAPIVQPTPNYGKTPEVTQQYDSYAQTYKNPETEKVNTVIQQLLNYGKNQQNFDPYSSSGYAAAQAQAQRSAQANTRAAQEAYGSAGFGRSTGLGERVAGINNASTEYLLTQVVPQLEAQEQARRQQEYNNILNALSPLMDQQGRSDKLVQQNQDNAFRKGDLLGSYNDPRLDDLYNQVLQQKDAYGAAKTAEERQQANASANAIRALIDQLGGDSSLVGANINSTQANANKGNFGQKTLGGQAQDLQNRQANLGAAMDVSNLTGSVVTPQNDWTGLYRQAADGGLGQTLEGQQVSSGLVSEQQNRDLSTREAAMREWQTTGYATPAVAQVLGVPEGTPTSDQSYRQATLTLDQDKFTYDQMADAAKANTVETVTAATAGDMLSQALQKVVGIDDEGKQKFGVLSDPTKREEAFVNMINTTGLRGNDVDTALTKAGYAINEINALQKEYPEVFQ